MDSLVLTSLQDLVKVNSTEPCVDLREKGAASTALVLARSVAESTWKKKKTLPPRTAGRGALRAQRAACHPVPSVWCSWSLGF